MILPGGRKPMFAGRYLACGWGEAFVFDGETQIAHLPGYWVCGWLDAVTLMLSQDGTWLRHTYDVTTGTLTAQAEDAPGAVAQDGGWGYTVPDHEAVYNGVVLSDTQGNLGAWVTGPWFLFTQRVTPERYDARICQHGALARSFQHQGPSNWHELCASGLVLYGDTGRVWAENTALHEEVSATTNGKELVVKERDGIYWSTVGSEARHLLQRGGLASVTGLLYELPRGAAEWDVANGVVAAQDNLGTLETFVLTDLPRETVTFPFYFEEPVQPVLLPVGRYVAPYVYFRDSQQYGDRLATPGASIIAGEPRAMPAENYPDEHGVTVPMMLDPTCLLHEQLDWWWDRVTHVYIASEGDVAKLVNLAELANYIMDWRGLPRREIVSYTAGLVPEPNDLWPTPIVGVQWYPESFETPESFFRRINDDVMPKVRDRRVAAVLAFYDRNGTLPHVERFVPAYRDLLAGWPNVELMLAFNDGRQNTDLGMGGMRYHPELYGWWSALIEACR